jgi:hypothetical protein
MTMGTRSQITTFVLALALAAIGCRNDPLIKSANRQPVAVARVINNGMPVAADSKDPAALAFAFMGQPVTVTLDATASFDPDGSIKGYRWLSGTAAPDGGVPHRSVPMGAAPNWPDDVAQPQVMLGEGAWTFSLWVIDNHDLLSDVSSISITVGKAVTPEVQACADKVVSTEPEACRTCLCSQGAMCQAAVTADKCDQTCWDLINCVAAHCPDFAAMAMKMPPDYSCLTANCMAYVGGASGATPATPCFVACPQECAGVPVGGMSGGTGGMGGGTGGMMGMGTGGMMSEEDGGL